MWINVCNLCYSRNYKNKRKTDVQINERGSYDMPTYLMTLSTRRQQIEEDFDRELQKRERSASPPIIRGASAIYSG